MEGKRKGTVTLILCVILLCVNLWQVRRISDLEQDIWNAQNSVMDNVNRMDSRLSSLYAELESADNLVQDWNYTSFVNVEQHSLTVELSVILKKWGEDTSAELLWINPNGTEGETPVPLSENGAGTFTGKLEIPLEGLSKELELDAIIRNGEVQSRESLGYLGDIASLLPVQCNSWGHGGPTYKNKTVTFTSCDVDLSGKAMDLEGLIGLSFRLTRNGEIAAEQAAKQGDSITRYTCGGMSAEGQPGDEFALTFFCRDKYGLGYEFCLNSWSIDEKGIRDAGTNRGYPILTWD